VPAGTYRLTLGDLSITDGLTLTGAGANVVTVDALGLNRVFEVLSSAAVTLSGLTITGGSVTGHGGGILNSGNLTLLNCAIDGNTATGMDGGSLAAGGQPQNPGTVSGLGAGCTTAAPWPSSTARCRTTRQSAATAPAPSTATPGAGAAAWTVGFSTTAAALSSF
jgi:hypothetical protein